MRIPRSVTAVTGVLLALAVFKLSLVVSQENTKTLLEDKYHKVPCDFEDGLCGWRNPDPKWTITRNCEARRWWGTCKTEAHYLRLQMDQLEENDNGTLISPLLVARTDMRCELSFLYRFDCDNDTCQLSVERQTHTGVEQLWNVTTYSGRRQTAFVDVPCSDIDYEILIVGKKVNSTGCHYLDVDNIDFKIFTLTTTPEGSTISSLSRRVSLTSLTSPEATSPPSSTSDGTVSFTITPTTNCSVTEPMQNPDKLSSDDEGLGTGPVVAIVVVIVIVFVVVVVIVVIVLRRRKGVEKHNRASGPAGSTSPGDANVGGLEGHDNLVYSANRLEMDTIPPMSGNAANPENTPDYYNVSGLKSPETPSAPAQDDVYENTRSPPPEEEYAVVDKNGQKKQDLQPEDEYALPNKDQQKKKREKQAGQGQQKNNIPTENKKKKGRKTDQQANKSDLNSNAAGRSTQEKAAAAAAGTSDYEPVAGDSGTASSRPEQPSDLYNNRGDKERAGMQLEPPQTHYDHLGAPDSDYSGMDLEEKIRDHQREAVEDQYSHI